MVPNFGIAFSVTLWQLLMTQRGVLETINQSFFQSIVLIRSPKSLCNADFSEDYMPLQSTRQNMIKRECVSSQADESVTE